MGEVFIVSAARTAVGSFGGSLKPVSAVELGSIALGEAWRRARNPVLDEVILGQVLTAGQGQGTARQAAMGAGVPPETPALTINKICGSGLKSVLLAAQAIKAGDAHCIAAGGMESMSNAAYASFDLRWGGRMGHTQNIDTMLSDGLWEVFNNYHMGITAENLAELYHISREEQDAFALSSQQKAAAALNSGAFKEEIAPVVIKGKKGEVIVEVDEHPRADASLEALSKLKPAFKPDGTVTAGNASGLNDGAAALVLMSAEALSKAGLTPLARVVAYAAAGVEPKIMGIGPVPATNKALAKAGWSMADIDLIEGNEAFAAQALAVDRELKFPLDKLNVNGGAIALGHPIGASGARILVTLLYSLKHRNKKRGLATLCIGGGMGAAILVERV